MVSMKTLVLYAHVTSPSHFSLQAEDQYGITPVLAAIWEGHTDCVNLLLSKVSI